MKIPGMRGLDDVLIQQSKQVVPLSILATREGSLDLSMIKKDRRLCFFLEVLIEIAKSVGYLLENKVSYGEDGYFESSIEENDKIMDWAMEFRSQNTDVDWRETDFWLCIDEFVEKKVKGVSCG